MLHISVRDRDTLGRETRDEPAFPGDRDWPSSAQHQCPHVPSGSSAAARSLGAAS